jgi:hypothetical protein
VAGTEPSATATDQATVDPGPRSHNGRIIGGGGGKAKSDRTDSGTGDQRDDAPAVAEPGDPDLPEPPTADGDDRDGIGDESAAAIHRDSRRLDQIPEEVTVLLPVARVARQRLIDSNQTVNRDTLAAQLRQDGHTVGNARAGVLLNLLKREPPGGSNGGRPRAAH